MFRQLASYVPCEKDELTRPLRGHPFSTRKGGALQHAFRFPYMRLAWVVQGKHQSSHPSTSSTPSLSREGFPSGGLWPPGFHHLPFQALRASFPEGKPIRGTFEAFVQGCFVSQPHMCLVRKMNLPGRFAATLSALERVGPGSMLYVFLKCALHL